MARLDIGGRTWDIPSLPWSVCKTLQPRIVSIYAQIKAAGSDEDAIMKLGEQGLDGVVDCIWSATQHATEGERLDRAAFDELPIAFGEIVRAIAIIAPAAGLRYGREGDVGKAPTPASSTGPA